MGSFKFEDPTIPEGTYYVYLEKVDEERSKKNGELFNLWTFMVIDGEFKDAKITDTTSMRMGPRSKTREWVQVLLGRKVDRGEEIEFDMLIGREAIAVVEINEETGFNDIARLKSVPRSAAA